ncbi:hypothetical protein B484DRAFT_453167, partial [Ochromonadaceae sp. CCMP2298]
GGATATQTTTKSGERPGTLPVSAAEKHRQQQEQYRQYQQQHDFAFQQQLYQQSLSQNKQSQRTQGSKENPQKYMLVGDSIVNRTELLKNAAKNTAQAQNRSVSESLSSLQALLGGKVPTKMLHGTAAAQAITGARVTDCTKKSVAGAACRVAKSALTSEVEDLLTRNSSHAEEADATWFEEHNKRMDTLSRREWAQTKAAEVTLLEIGAFKCAHPQCHGRITEANPALCVERGHPVRRIDAVKCYFECSTCSKREFSLAPKAGSGAPTISLPPEVRCRCGNFGWRKCGQRGSGPLAVSAMDQAQVGRSLQPMVLSASEWTTRGETGNMAERVARL